ncbi:putative vacuolar fusion protein Ccz1 [Helianthus anomalus]
MYFCQIKNRLYVVGVCKKQREKEAIWRIEALHSVLKEVNPLFVMFHGFIRICLIKNLVEDYS